MILRTINSTILAMLMPFQLSASGPIAHNCAVTLGGIIATAVLGNGKKEVTQFDSFATALRSTDMPDGDVKHLLHVIKTSMEIAVRNNNEFLLPAVNYINRHGSESSANKNLLVCAVGVGCRLNPAQFGDPNAGTGHVMVASNFLVQNIGDTYQNAEAPLRTSGLSREEVLFLTPYQSDSGPHGVMKLALWLGQFFRDVTQSTTIDQISNWIETNENRFKRGEQVDPFFTYYIAKTVEGRYIIDKGFYTFLTLSRSRSAYVEAIRDVLTEVGSDPVRVREVVNLIEAKERALTIEHIRQQASQRTIGAFGLTENNVFEMGLTFFNLLRAQTQRP